MSRRTGCTVTRHQPGADEEHHRERDLDDDQTLPEQLLSATHRIATAVLEHQREGGTGGLQCGHEAEEKCREECGEEREAEDGAVDADAVDARKVRGLERHEQANASQRDEQPERCPRERDDTALDEELTHDADPRGAECGAHGELAFARRGAGEEEIRDVRAGDEQDERHGAEQRPDDGAHVRREVFDHRHDVEAIARGLSPFVLTGELVRDAHDVRAAGLDRDAILEPTDDAPEELSSGVPCAR
jgi:hypothetical protein